MERVATDFAPAERATAKQTDAQNRKLQASPLIAALLDSFPESAVILNQQRQILFANDKLANLLGRSRGSLSGLRHGEALNCINAGKHPGGCGTTRFCRHCGAVNAILKSQRSDAPAVEECRIQRCVDGETSALDLRVWATPVVVEGEPFTVFAMRDTTDEKRRQVLERLFFHDALNSVAGLSAILEMQGGQARDDSGELAQMAREYADELTETIVAQRDLAAAERGDFQVNVDVVHAKDVLARLRVAYSAHSAARGRTLVVRSDADDDAFRTDGTLLGRVLGNLILNALEASSAGQTVTVWFENETAPTFHVHNDSVMPETVREQMFQRSFSTKGGSGRGLGTYSVKLFTERYLDGTVDFSSGAEGTTFTVRLPRRVSTGT